MKKNLKINLKRLTSGFISSVMMMSFILMPIPNVSVVYAETNEDGVVCPDEAAVKNGAIYVPGCEFNKALATTTMESDRDYNESGISKFISQYIVGMMGVILINSLRWKRLSKYNVEVYGNDCKQNFGPVVSMPTGMVSGLLYIIGDLQSNIQFQAAAKKAADEYDMELTDLQAYTGKAKVHEGSGEVSDDATDEEKKAIEDAVKAAQDGNNAQAKGYDALLAVLIGQKKALKTKRNMAGASAIGYALADAVELINMIAMHSTCVTQWSAKATKDAIATGEYAAAQAGVTAAGVPPLPTAVACAPAAGALAAHKGVSTAKEAKQLVLGQLYGAKKATDSAVAVKETTSILGKITGAFGGKAGAAVGVVAGLGDKAKDDLDEVAAAIARAGKDSTDIAAISAFATPLGATDKAADVCVPTKALKDNSTGNEVASLGTTVSCCGGPGVNTITYAYASGIVTALGATNLLAAAKAQALKAGKKKLINLVVDKAISEVTGGFDELTKKVYEKVKGSVKKSQLPESGSYWWQGVPAAPGLFSLRKDIKVLSLFGEGGSPVGSIPSYMQTPEMNKQQVKELETMKFFVRNSFESNVRDMTRSLVNYDMDKPLATLKSIADNEKKIQRVMMDFDKYLDSDLIHMAREEQVNPKSLAFQKVIDKIKSEFFMPKAHAGMTGSLIGMVASEVGKKIGGPWGEVLNVGGKIMALHSMLGKYAKRYALNRPVTRALTWTGMGLLSNWTRKITNNAIDKVDNNIKVIETEKQKFLDSGTTGSGFAGNRSGMGRDGLRNANYGENKQGKRFIKACVVADGDSYLPSTCGAVTPIDKFRVKGLSRTGDINNNPMGFSNGVMTATTFGAANDPDYAANMSDGDLAGIDSANAAMAKLVEKKRKLYDDIMDGSKAYKDAGGQSLQANIAKLRKVLFNDGVSGSGGLGGSGGSSSSAPLASTKPTETLGTGNVVSGGGSGGGGSAPVAAIPSFDLDFGDEGGVAGAGSDAIGAAKSGKKTQKLGDFVMKHNDINKRKDISIFKILSNRYILSYPKVLEEETSVQK